MSKNTVAKKLNNGDVALIDVKSGVMFEVIGRGLLENDPETKARVEEHTYDFNILYANIQKQLRDATVLLKKMPNDAEAKKAVIDLEIAERSIQSLFKGYGVQV